MNNKTRTMISTAIAASVWAGFYAMIAFMIPIKYDVGLQILVAGIGFCVAYVTYILSYTMLD